MLIRLLCVALLMIGVAPRPTRACCGPHSSCCTAQHGKCPIAPRGCCAMAPRHDVAAAVPPSPNRVASLGSTSAVLDRHFHCHPSTPVDLPLVHPPPYRLERLPLRI